MKPGAGKRKGSSFERATARRLSLWITNGTDRKQLIRSVLSGGWSDRDKRQIGDLAPNGPIGESFRATFAVECKHQLAIDIWDLFTLKDGGRIVRWWAKLCAEVGTTAGVEEPMLIMRSNRKPDIVVLRSMFVRNLSLAVDAPLLGSKRYGLTLLPFAFMVKQPPEMFVANLWPK